MKRLIHIDYACWGASTMSCGRMLTLPPTAAEPSRGGTRDVPARSAFDRASVRGNAFVAFFAAQLLWAGDVPRSGGSVKKLAAVVFRAEK